MLDTCAAKGFEAVELDNLDSWTRREVPFGQAEAVAYAELLADHAHTTGLAVAQKNTPELGAAPRGTWSASTSPSPRSVGCTTSAPATPTSFGSAVIDVEYTAEGFAAACATVGDGVSVVLRDVAVSTPEDQSYVYDSC